jgi:hypothetical protein
LKLLIIANSLAYYDHENRWYDVETLDSSDMYPKILAKLDSSNSIKVVAVPWMTIFDVLQIVKDSRRYDGDIFVLHVGIVECIRRIYPIAIRRAVNSLGSRKIREWINNFEKGLLMIPLNRDGWISHRKFGQVLKLICLEVERKFRPKILVLVTINRANKKFESAHPGTNRNVALHNREIEALGGTRNIKILRADRILDSNCFLSDGIHLNRRGHQLLAEAVVDSIKLRLPNSSY